MFSGLGSPLYESFAGTDICEVDCQKKYKSDKKLSKCYQDRVEAECDGNDGNEGKGNEDKGEKDDMGDKDKEDKGEKDDMGDKEDKGDTDDMGDKEDKGDTDDDDEDEGDDEDEDDEKGVTTETFIGNDTIEGFVGNSGKINLHFVLKCILFACLFFILAHDDTRNYLVSMVKIKKGQYIYLGSVLFFVIYLILNMIL